MAPSLGMLLQVANTEETPGDRPLLTPGAPIHSSWQGGTQDTETPPNSSPDPGGDMRSSRRHEGRCRRLLRGHLVLAAAGGLIVGGVLVFTAFTASRGLSRPPGSPCCPNKWTRSDDKCYFISRKTKNWTSSLEFCQTEGGTLLTMDHETQQQLKTLHDLAGDYWVGLTKDADSGKWRQLDGSVWARLIEFDDPQRNCCFVHSGKYAALDCTTARRWICVKSLQRKPFSP